MLKCELISLKTTPFSFISIESHSVLFFCKTQIYIEWKTINLFQRDVLINIYKCAMVQLNCMNAI